MEKFDTIKIEKIVYSETRLRKEGMEVNFFISGVNSGVYGLPFVVTVKTWAKKWFFKKFFYREMKLDLNEVKMLKEECEKVIEFYNKKINK